MQNKFIAIMLALLMLLSMTACGGKSENVDPAPPATATPVPTSASTPTPEPTPEPAPEPTPYNGPVNPLTGEPVDEDISGRRPIAVMLNNIREAQPQQGNSRADIIYEVIAEGGITRMLGVYQSVEGVDMIGSVRSARPYYIELALGHDAIFVHAGGSEQAYSDLSNWGVDNMDGVNGRFSYSAAGVFYRDQYRMGDGKKYAYEHSLLTSGERIMTAVENYGIRAEHTADFELGLSFSDDGTPTEGVSAGTITVPFSNYKTGVFTYDADTGLYMVEEYGSPYIDGNDGSQVSVTNVITLQIPCKSSGDSYGHMIVTLDSGSGWYACGGRMVPIRWEKGNRNSPFRYYNEDGSELQLGRGRTYVNLIPLENTPTAE
ncbi:MAG: DUF3048 domain-containing protein [Clostridiales bacterium]|nr:DUF3048 domain-containing protein [Clostridiales bacterium]